MVFSHDFLGFTREKPSKTALLRLNLYISKRIIIMVTLLAKKKEVEELYKDAIVLHLLREGMSPNRAEAEARRRMTRDDAL
jgi:hypothetical protein